MPNRCSRPPWPAILYPGLNAQLAAGAARQGSGEALPVLEIAAVELWQWFREQLWPRTPISQAANPRKGNPILIADGARQPGVMEIFLAGQGRKSAPEEALCQSSGGIFRDAQ